ncbi:NrfD/PsrC family molybdoenzyme membrane anchor subunit [Halalkalirubrum salinum]|uniref:NrfD/PsrC family molybdoenzyme membrane anchor subunit n=1 Tax=Halalkalirubrum salinum TaxID=2563889 RepID=UPI0010FB550D|nr:NrfD/PsrC family molybdoenzyme membrane anchor subunit [Halalkalirubrum salinum]
MSQSTGRRVESLNDIPTGKRFVSWLVLIGAGFLVGLYGAFRVLTEGTIALGISNQLPWGILISTYEFFLLTSAGIMVGIVSLALVFDVGRFDRLLKRGLLLALATLAAGLFTIAIGLGRPERPIIHAVINANPSSPIWWVIMFAGTFGAVLVALLVLVETDWVDSPSLTKLVGVAGLGVGLAVMVAAGMIFGTLPARPYYGGALAPVYFIITGILSGIAAVGAVVIAEHKLTGRDMSPELSALMTDYVGKLVGVLAGAGLVIAAIKAIYGLTSTSDSTAMAYEQMLLGSFAPIYWGLGILVGLVVPIALMTAKRTRTPTGVLAASAAALVGLFVTRYEFVVGGQVVALTADPGHQYPIVSYIPSGVEIALIVFALALAAFIYTAGTLLMRLDEPPAEPTADHGGYTHE